MLSAMNKMRNKHLMEKNQILSPTECKFLKYNIEKINFDVICELYIEYIKIMIGLNVYHNNCIFTKNQLLFYTSLYCGVESVFF